MSVLPRHAPSASILALALIAVVGPACSRSAESLPRATSGGPPGMALSTIHMFDAHAGWATDSRQCLLRTADGGSSWSPMPPLPGVGSCPPHAAADFSAPEEGAVSLIDPNRTATTFLMSHGAWAQVSVAPVRFGDTGAKLQIEPVPGLPAPLLNLELFGTGVVEPQAELLKSHDGGHHWDIGVGTDSPPPQVLPYAGTITFWSDGNHGWMTGHRQTPGVDPALWVLASSAGGGDWAPVSLPVPQDADLTPVTSYPPQFFGPRVFLPADFAASDGRGRFFTSPDLGVHWGATSGLPTGVAVSMFADPLVGYVVGLPGTPVEGELFKTVNGGSTWTMIPAAFHDPKAIDFVDRNNGWILYGTSLARTSDGARTWRTLRPVMDSP